MQHALSLYPDSVVLPRWGRATNAAFKQQRVIEMNNKAILVANAKNINSTTQTIELDKKERTDV